jgi:hypothetical protein
MNSFSDFDSPAGHEPTRAPAIIRKDFCSDSRSYEVDFSRFRFQYYARLGADAGAHSITGTAQALSSRAFDLD